MQDNNKVQLLGQPLFFEKTMGGWQPQMNFAPYYGSPFNCACGASHSFSDEIEILRELSGRRIVVTCPSSDCITCVKIKGLFWFKGFESLFGTCSEEE